MMTFLLPYFLLCTGFFSFLFSAAGHGATYTGSVDKALLVLSSAYCLYLFLRREVSLSTLSLVIGGYIILRMIVVGSFALINGYTLAGYLFPLKNWVILLNLFIIGQSIRLPEEAVYRLLLKALTVTVLVIGIFEIGTLLLGIDLKTFFPLGSRIPLVKYRIAIDEFIIVLSYLILCAGLMSDRLSSGRYGAGVAVIGTALLISQTRQLLLAVIMVSLFVVMKKFKPYLTRRKLIYTTTVAVAASGMAWGIFQLVARHPADTYFSLWRRLLSMEYVREKVAAYPIFGYPIPSLTFGGAVPRDIVHHFYGFDFNVTIFPSDMPLLFLLSEEGATGFLFVGLLFYLCYRKSPDRAPYLLIALLSLIGTFRMYYLIPVGSSFTYFMLGLATRKKTEG